MDLTSKRTIRFLLKKYHIYPSRRLGQNFLIDNRVVKKLIEAADLKPNDIILEVGPGLGVLTKEITKRAKKIIAVEKDPRMCKILKETLKNIKDVQIINDDILRLINSKATLRGVSRSARSSKSPCLAGRREKSKLQFKSSPLGSFSLRSIQQNYKVVANLPFYLTSPLIRKFLETEKRPKEMVLMVQKEVAQRICAKPKKMNLLAVSVHFYAKPKIVSYVSKKSFWPSPKVDSAIIKITPLNNRRRGRASTGLFFKVVKAGFSHPRKQLANNLSNELKLDKEQVKLWLLKNNIQPTHRAETLNIANWIRLAKSSKLLTAN